MKKLSGWQMAGLVAGVGCFTIVAILAVGIAIAVVRARSIVADLGDPTPRRVETSIPLESRPATDAGGTADAGATADRQGPLRLDVSLEEASFVVRPGPPGTEVQVDGTYADGRFALTENHASGPRGQPRTTIVFKSKAPAWARILAGLGSEESRSRPKVSVLIPRGAPIDLSLHVAFGDSSIDLGGLSLNDLDLDLAMGNHRLDFSEPLAGPLRRVNLDARMGNVSVDNLGNARAASIISSGSMGNVTADLAGSWQPGAGADLSFTQSMGQLTVRVPKQVRLQTDVRASQGQVQSPPSTDETADPDAPELRLRVTASMGDGRVLRY